MERELAEPMVTKSVQRTERVPVNVAAIEVACVHRSVGPDVVARAAQHSVNPIPVPVLGVSLKSTVRRWKRARATKQSRVWCGRTTAQRRSCQHWLAKVQRSSRATLRFLLVKDSVEKDRRARLAWECMQLGRQHTRFLQRETIGDVIGLLWYQRRIWCPGGGDQRLALHPALRGLHQLRQSSRRVVPVSAAGV